MTRRSSRSSPAHDGSGAQQSAFDVEVPPFVSVDREPSPLVQRARTFLEAGPSNSVPLIEHVCRLPGAPPAVAEQLALALFTETSDVQRDADGRWTLVRERVLPARAKGELARRSLETLT